MKLWFLSIREGSRDLVPIPDPRIPILSASASERIISREIDRIHPSASFFHRQRDREIVRRRPFPAPRDERSKQEGRRGGEGRGGSDAPAIYQDRDTDPTSHSRSRSRVFPAGEGFNDHVASPIPSRRSVSSTFADRVSPAARENSSIRLPLLTPARPPSLIGTPTVRLFLSRPPGRLLGGGLKRIHYASVQFADFQDRGNTKGGTGREVEGRLEGEGIRGRIFEKEENVGTMVGESKMDRHDAPEGRGTSRSRLDADEGTNDEIGPCWCWDSFALGADPRNPLVGCSFRFSIRLRKFSEGEERSISDPQDPGHARRFSQSGIKLSRDERARSQP